MNWTPQNPQMNKHDILLYAKHLIEYVEGKTETYSCTLYGFFRDFLEDEVADGKTRKQWQTAHIKRFAILKPGTYPIHYYPEDDPEEDGQIEILQECIIQDSDSIEVPWGAMERYISVDPTHSELEIESLDLPRFTQEMCGKIISDELPFHSALPY